MLGIATPLFFLAGTEKPPLAFSEQNDTPARQQHDAPARQSKSERVLHERH